MKSWTLYLLLMVVLLCNCSQENLFDNIKSNYTENFLLQNDDANMPVFIEGNFDSENIILFVAGGPGDGSLLVETYHPFSDQIEEDNIVVYWEQRGSGIAYSGTDDDKMTIAQYVEDLEILIDELQNRYGSEKKIFLMGHSWGGMLSVAYLSKSNNQDDITGFIEISGGHDFPLLINSARNNMIQCGNEQISQQNHVEDWQKVLEVALSMDTVITIEEVALINDQAPEAEYLMGQALGFIEPLNVDYPPQLNKRWVRKQREATNEKFAPKVFNLSLSSELPKIHIPTLLVYSQYDFAVPSQVGEDAFGKLGTPEADKFLKIYDKSGHAIWQWETDKLAHDIIEFVEMY